MVPADQDAAFAPLIQIIEQAQARAYRAVNREQIDSALFERTMLSNEKSKEIVKHHPELAALRDSYAMEWLDLPAHHRELSCLVAIELKTGSFRPEHLGQLNFYLEALDCDVRKPNENPSVGLILCTDKDDAVVEYSLSRSLSPAMVADYQLHLPDKKMLEAKLSELTTAAELEVADDEMIEAE